MRILALCFGSNSHLSVLMLPLKLVHFVLLACRLVLIKTTKICKQCSAVLLAAVSVGLGRHLLLPQHTDLFSTSSLRSSIFISFLNQNLQIMLCSQVINVWTLYHFYSITAKQVTSPCLQSTPFRISITTFDYRGLLHLLG